MNPHTWRTNFPEGCAPEDVEGGQDDEQPESLYTDGPNEPNDRDLEF